jgi:hypothetical protein
LFFCVHTISLVQNSLRIPTNIQDKKDLPLTFNTRYGNPIKRTKFSFPDITRL